MSDSADRIIEATMDLLADRPFEEVGLRSIADHAGVGLAELAAAFPSRTDILGAFAAKIDRAVLAGDFSDMADQPPRERLFDVLMSRLDALRPYRAALKSLMHSVRRDPALAVALNAVALRSQGWMLAAAGIDAPGWRGRIITQGLALSFAQVLRTFLDEDDPGMPRTMARLDKALRDAQKRYERFARVFGPAMSNVTEPPAATASTTEEEPATPPEPAPEPIPAAEPVAQEPAPTKPAARKRARTPRARSAATPSRRTRSKRAAADEAE
ncbi:TetR family transcriptional regulator [Acuticoccus mangrovi]|uniref:Helix-turn-helix transcriptional regulator n=1 Tax=Acuticoccus mangrovi TaxID=2796142 RepID=A0A934MGM6_9HYPH|nr:helix-turn-helix transcriptional regulator [Acuticoccus mangrovi]